MHEKKNITNLFPGAGRAVLATIVQVGGGGALRALGFI